MGTRQGDHVFYRNLHRDYPVLCRGDGVYLYDRSGKRYLDGAGGALVCSIGHGSREVAEHVRRQAETLAFAPIARFTHDPQIELAERLARMGSPHLPYAYFVSSGSEAVETAIKMARQFHVECGERGKSLVIGRQPSYHGNTLACLSAGGNAGRRRHYAPYLFASPKIALPHCASCPYHLSYPSCDLYCARQLEREILRAGPENVSCFIAETVTGSSGGVIIPPRGYLKLVAEICARHRVVLIADEIMCGTGRTGRFLATSHFDALPDICILGKGITSGYTPLAALLVSERVYAAFEAGSGAFINNFTFAANPLSCATACKVLEIVERDGLIARADRAGSFLRGLLSDLAGEHPHLGANIRGVGLMMAVDIFKDRGIMQPFDAADEVAERLTRACLDEGLVVYPSSLALADREGECILLGPPFVISESESEELVMCLVRAMSRVLGA
ncbi:MAG: aminotransferase class III-fold pyridoxal phosphate-dependent enzyme [Acidobacteriota bacterium]